MTKPFFSQFTNLYPIQKTLRRELKPLNENFEHDPSLSSLRNSEIPQRDEQSEKAQVNSTQKYIQHDACVGTCRVLVPA